MLHQLLKLLILCGLIVGGSYAIYRYEKGRSTEARLQQQIKQLEEQRRHLQQFVARLTSTKRVAEIVVTDQVTQGPVVVLTTLMFVEYGPDGKRLPPRFFNVKGNVAHIDALVITFKTGFLEKDDPLRGHSLLLFHRVFGDHQMPADAFPIDDPGKPPAAYRADTGQTPAARAFEAELWQTFWKLADDVKYREEKGVEVAHGTGVWTFFNPDKVYTVSLGPTGAVSMSSRPMEGLWRELRDAIKQQKP